MIELHPALLLPHTGRSGKQSGAEIIEVETEAELRSKLSDQTAMIYIISGPRAFEEPLSIKTVCALAKEKNVPVFIDAAAKSRSS
jgi:seryl-tRNA(Sec) selenium transferase